MQTIRGRFSVLLVAAFLGAAVSLQAEPLKTADLQIQGMSLAVATEHATVQLGTSAVIQTKFGGKTNSDAPTIDGARVLGDLVGPGITTSIEFTTAPGYAFNVAGLTSEGVYYLQNIRLVDRAGNLLQVAVPSFATIEVTNAFKTTVKVTQLTPEQLRARGITVDPSNYDVYEYTFSFLVDGKTVEIPYPVIIDRTTHEVQPVQRETPYVIPSEKQQAPPRWSPPTSVPIELAEDGVFTPPPQQQGGGGDSTQRRPSVHAAIVIPNSIAVLHQFKAGATLSDPNGGLLKQILHGGLQYDDPLEVTFPNPNAPGKLARLYPVFDEAGTAAMQVVLNANGEVVARNVPNDAFGGENASLGGSAVDRIQVKATKNEQGALTGVEISVRTTDAIRPDSVGGGLRIAALDGSGNVVATSNAAPELADAYTARVSLTAAQWTAITTATSATTLSIGVRSTLRAAAWGETSILAAPEWVRATKPVFSSAELPVEFRESLPSLTQWIAGVGTSDTRKLYEIDNLSLLASGGGASEDALDEVVASRFQAMPFVEPVTELTYVRARWYEGRACTWLAPDPLLYADGSSLYSFEGGDSLNRRDPSGQLTESQLKVIEWISNTSRGLKGRFGERALERILASNNRTILEGPLTSGKGVFEEGADLIVYNKATKRIEFWDSKYFTRAKNVSTVPTLTQSARMEKNIARARDLIEDLGEAADPGMMTALESRQFDRYVGKAGLGNNLKGVTARVEDEGVKFADIDTIRSTGRSEAEAARVARRAARARTLLHGAAVVATVVSLVMDVNEVHAAQVQDEVFGRLVKDYQATDKRFTVSPLIANAGVIRTSLGVIGEETGAFGGGALGFAGAGLLGVPTGPGAFATGVAGAAGGGWLGGKLGRIVGETVANWIVK